MRILLMMALLMVGLHGWGQVVDTLQKKNPIEWGRSYKKEFIPIQEFKKPGISTPLNVQVQTVENILTNKKYYYVRFEGYGTPPGIRITLINEDELEEVITFCKNLSEYTKQTKIPIDTEYHYDSFDNEFRIGAFWNPKNIKWTFFIEVDPIGMISANYYYDTTFISQFYQVLMICKSSISRLKEGKF